MIIDDGGTLFPCSLQKQPNIQPCADEAGDEADEHPPAGLDEMVFLLVVGLVHVLGVGQSHGL